MKRYFSFLLLTIICVTAAHGQLTTISGEIDNLKKDTIQIILFIDNITRKKEVYNIPVNDGRFTGTLQITRPTYFYANDGSNYVGGLIDPGDRIAFRYHADSANTTLQFKGTGAEKMSFINSFSGYLFGEELYDRLKERLPIAKTKKHPFDHLFDYADSVGHAMLNNLDSIKRFMTPESYHLLKADIKATVMREKHRYATYVYQESINETLKKRQNELTASSKQYLQNILSFDQAFFYSSKYIIAIYNMLFMNYSDLVSANEAGKGLMDKYAYLSEKLPGKLKVPVLTLFLEQDIGALNQAEDIEALISGIYASPQDSVYRNYIEKRYSDATAFKKGMSAPEFTLENEKGEKVTLASFKGKVVYLDFWYDACVPCHALFAAIKPVKKYFSSKNEVVFLTVSIDAKEAWEASLKKHEIPGDHVFTENKKSDHPVIKSYKVAGYPTTCLIDRNGKIFAATPSNNPEELQKQIEDALTIESN